MSYPQPHLAQWRKPHYTTGNMQQFMIGKVIKFYPDSNSADVALLRGGTLYKVLCLSPNAGRDYGILDMPQPDNLFPDMATAGGAIDSPVGSGNRDIYAMVVFAEGMSSQAMIVGFMPPAVTNMAFTADIRVHRHANGVYSWGHQNPNDYSPAERVYFEAVTPAGSRITVGGPEGATDLSKYSFDKTWAGAKGYDERRIVLEHGNSNSSVTITQEGDILLKHPLSGLHLHISPTGDLEITNALSVKITGVQTTIEVSAAQSISLTAPVINLNGSVVVDGQPLQIP